MKRGTVAVVVVPLRRRGRGSMRGWDKRNERWDGRSVHKELFLAKLTELSVVKKQAGHSNTVHELAGNQTKTLVLSA